MDWMEARLELLEEVANEAEGDEAEEEELWVRGCNTFLCKLIHNDLIQLINIRKWNEDFMFNFITVCIYVSS